MPERSPEFFPVMPPSPMTPFVVRRFTMLFLEAGPLHDADDCSQIEQVERLAETETPEPLLVPRGTRAVSYGLQAWPLQGAYCRLVSGVYNAGLAGPFADAPVTLLAEATANMIAPLLRSAAMSGESTRGTSIAKFTSLPPVPRMSLASYQSLSEKTAQYMGRLARSGLRPYWRSSSSARSSASGIFRNSSQGFGAPAGRGPADGARSKSPLQVMERSPRTFSVSSAFSCPASGMPTRQPYCSFTLGS